MALIRLWWAVLGEEDEMSFRRWAFLTPSFRICVRNFWELLDLIDHGWWSITWKNLRVSQMKRKTRNTETTKWGYKNQLAPIKIVHSKELSQFGKMVHPWVDTSDEKECKNLLGIWLIKLITIFCISWVLWSIL